MYAYDFEKEGQFYINVNGEVIEVSSEINGLELSEKSCAWLHRIASDGKCYL